jgi:hypothetical protein
MNNKIQMMMNNIYNKTHNKIYNKFLYMIILYKNYKIL